MAWISTGLKQISGASQSMFPCRQNGLRLAGTTGASATRSSALIMTTWAAPISLLSASDWANPLGRCVLPSFPLLRQLMLLLLLCLSACATRAPAPVEERGTTRPSVRVVEPQSYTVVRGDTLYSIAFRYGVDWRELARWNQIGSPYLIHPGDRLYLADRTTSLAQSREATVNAAAQTSRPQTGSSTSRGSTTSPATKAAETKSNAGSSSSATAKPSTNSGKPATKAKPTPPPSSRSARDKQTARAPAPSKSAPAKSSAKAAPAKVESQTNQQGGVTWHWPATGKLKRGFVANDNTRQGIDLAGTNGDKVKAAADGIVVYSGTGLIGYGELIIIKHNDRLLSAYGHNRKRLVAEGETVKAGQLISEMGENSSGEAVLHFEIRVEGKPQNPLSYLPKR